MRLIVMNLLGVRMERRLRWKVVGVEESVSVGMRISRMGVEREKRRCTVLTMLRSVDRYPNFTVHMREEEFGGITLLFQ